MKNLSRLAVTLLSLWLLAWIVFSWGGIQDDALIHLRYADYLHRLHFITYDGVHASYGTSSLFYVGLLAALCSLSSSPYLSRIVSTFFHLILFCSLAALTLRTTRRSSMRVQLLALTLLFMVALPSAVRWLDDGMETGLVLCLVTLDVWWTHRLSIRQRMTTPEILLSAILGFSLVFLRNELAIVAMLSTLILVLVDAGETGSQWLSQLIRAVPRRASFIAGGILAALTIRIVMHSFLPDTALAKSHGIHFVFGSLKEAGIVLTGALLFGFGGALLWLLSAAIVLLDPRERIAHRLTATLAANLLFPCVLVLSALRGQEIQGVRYLVWTFFFSILWNLLELRSLDTLSIRTNAPVESSAANSQTSPLALFGLSAFLLICLVVLPFESRLMARVLTTRSSTMKLFLGQNLPAALPNQLGIATDVGYISYYTRDNICDSAGLVNGRAAAALSEAERDRNCIAQHPGFVFVNSAQAATLAKVFDFSAWSVCATYDFGNMRIPDRHYLLVRPDLAPHACEVLGNQPAPASIAFLTTTYH